MRTPLNQLVIPFFIPHAGCPHQCSFCNQRTISGKKTPASPGNSSLEDAVNLYLGYAGKRPSSVQLAFFGGNFLGMGSSSIIKYLEEARSLKDKGLIDTIRFSTRPDTINPATMSLIKDYPVSVIEIGTQSMDPVVLELSLRGHSAEDTVKAAEICMGRGYETGIQMMIGLPGEDRDSCRLTCEAICNIRPDFVRIYPTVVVAGSPLAESYEKGEYIPLETGEAVIRAKELYLNFTARSIRIIRMGLQATDDLIPGTTVLAGPYHPAFGHLVLSSIMLDRIRAEVERLYMSDVHAKRHEGRGLRIICNKKSISRVRGDRNDNIRFLQTSYGFSGIRVESDPDLDPGLFRLELF